MVTIQALPFLFLLGVPAVAYFSSLLYVGIFKRFEPEEQVQDGENLAPLSFIVEEEQAKQAALEAEAAAKTAESAENKTETDAVETENQI